MGFLEQLRQATPEVIVEAVQKPPSQALCDVASPELPATLADVEKPQEPATTLRQALLQAQDWQDLEPALEKRIRYARSWDELDAIAEGIQPGFEEGRLTQAQAERLTYLSIETARLLEAGLVNVPAAAFIAKEECPGAPVGTD